jgi:tetratricopeptide (TPR) repeat protein
LEALSLSQEIADKRLEMMVTQDLAELYCNIKKPEEALLIAESVLQLSSEIGDIDCRLNALYSLASTKLHLGWLDEAENHCLEILQDPYIFSTHLYWGVIQVIRHVYLLMGEYEKNLDLTAGLLEKARREEAGEYWLSELGYFNGIHFSVLGKYQEALETFEKGTSFMVKANEPGQAAVSLGIMAHYAAMLGDLDLAQDYLEQAFRYCSGLEESLNYAFVLYLSAEVMIMDGRPDAVKLGLKQQTLGLEIKQKLQLRHNWSEHFILADLLMILASEDPSYAAEALITIEKAIGAYKENQFGWSPPEYLFSTASQIYRANQQIDKADEYLNKAYARLMLAVGNIKDDNLRDSFLENVRWNRQILAEAKSHGIA